MAEKKEEAGKVYKIPLGKVFNHPKTKRASKAVKKVKNFLSKKAGEEVKLEKSVNEKIWRNGRENPPREITVKLESWGEILRAELAE